MIEDFLGQLRSVTLGQTAYVPIKEWLNSKKHMKKGNLAQPAKRRVNGTFELRWHLD